ncbi:hypothetical protein [Bradyrhizobium septentrionale]|nr:hypothetical protein [Bradyrhizobium septentrionale]
MIPTLFLLAWRNAMIATMAMMLAPLEGAFTAVEDELERRGVEL